MHVLYRALTGDLAYVTIGQDSNTVTLLGIELGYQAFTGDIAPNECFYVPLVS
jgi:hypothetical protein